MAERFTKLDFITTCVVFFILSLSIKCTTHVQTSSFQLQRLVEDELNFLKELYDYASALEYHAKQVREYINDVYSNYPNDVYPGDDLEAFVGHPLNALGLMKRTGHDFPLKLEPILNNETLINLHEKLVNRSKRFPDVYDYQETCSSIALLHEAYNLNISDLTHGQIKLMKDMGHHLIFNSDFNLDWIQVYQIGTTASNRGWHDSAVVWLQRAVELCPDRNDPTFADLMVDYKKAVEYHDQVLENNGRKGKSFTEQRTFALPLDKKLRKKKKYRKIVQKLKDAGGKEDIMVEKEKHYTPLFQYDVKHFKSGFPVIRHTRDNFHSLCKEGEKNWRTPEVNLNLTCRFQHHNDPYIKLGPFLVEETNYMPFVAVFHNFMSSIEMKHFKEVGASTLVRSYMGSSAPKTVGGYTGKIRTSSQGWIEERFYRFPTTDKYTGWDYNGTFHLTEEMFGQTIPEIPPNVQDYLIINDTIAYGITKRIELATQLTTDRPYASESYQVVNYGTGGQYAPHGDGIGYYTHPGVARKRIVADSALEYYACTGDRYATFMVYLSSVELGGGTVFPLLGLNNNAVSGDAIFWNGAWSEGRMDYLTIHGGCPILVGSKWITNKWIQYHDQFRQSPCDLEEYQRVKTFTKWRRKQS